MKRLSEYLLRTLLVMVACVPLAGAFLLSAAFCLLESGLKLFVGNGEKFRRYVRLRL